MRASDVCQIINGLRELSVFVMLANVCKNHVCPTKRCPVCIVSWAGLGNVGECETIADWEGQRWVISAHATVQGPGNLKHKLDTK